MHHMPYILNVLILAPVLLGMVQMTAHTPVAAFSGVPDQPALRMMVVSLWSGVLVLSLVALYDPLSFWPLLAFQVVYKAIFLAAYCLPIWLGRAEGVIPWGPVGVFIGIILIWPFFIAAALRSAQMLRL
ncbi:MAG: hypothetical protein AAF744_15585 [Pseudomonadota bacterium]